MQKYILVSHLALFLTACSEIEPKPFLPSTGHIDPAEQSAGEIPELVTQAPVLPAPAVMQEKYTVVVNEVPVKELLFALVRDAQVNVDIDPKVEGVATVNAIEQTLPQILNRIARQVDLRYELSGDTLYIQPDEPFLRTYAVDYVNISREMESTNTIATQISSTSGGDFEGSGSGNNSTMDVSSTSNYHFWGNLVSGISAILGELVSAGAGGEVAITDSVIPNPGSGIIVVKATESQHAAVQGFIDIVVGSAKRQVLIQATIVEVTLSDRYQAGIDWSFVNQAGKAGINLVSETLAATTIAPALLSSFVLEAVDPDEEREQSLTATISLLDEFGDAKVLSSPQIMTLNNQTALLKVVQNFVYFEVDVEPGEANSQGTGAPGIDTSARTVPVGIVMTVTPQIDAGDIITLNVRPTISRVIGTVLDPNPELARAEAENPVPIIAVREMESMLRLTNGQIGVLGGLMTDEFRDRDAGLPGVKALSFFGKLFKSRSAEYSKTELVIFLRPVLIKEPSLTGDLADHQQYFDGFREFATQDTGLGTGSDMGLESR